MKTKISKKVISICLSLLICISALPLSMLSASAAEYDITIRNVVYPRPGAVPQADIKKESVSRYNLYGWAWMGNDDTVAMGPDEKFTDFFSLVLGSSGDFYYELDTFTDTVSYNLSLMFVLKDKIVISGVECDVVFYDENNTVRGVTQGMFLPVKYARTQAEAVGIALPEDLTDNDTIMVCSTSSMMCCPEDHIHIQGQYSYDDNGHWRECTVCGEKIFDSEGKHRKYCTKTESWTCINQATASKEGEYVKECSGCSYVMERITVPKTGEQTVVTTYDELRNALAKGGRQWIKLDFPGKIFKQEDFKYDYTLCLDDPDADITIDLNNCLLERKTLYDKRLFEIKQGKLRLWQKDGNGIDSTVNFKYNFSFDTGNGEAVFYVGDSGSLTLTNVHSLSPGSDDIGTFTYAFPIVKSSGNLRIDSGIYYSYNETPAVEIDGGTAVINGGYFKSTYYKSSAVKITAPDKEKTTVEINYGNFGALNTAVYMDRDTVVTINGGNFEYKDTDRNLYQKYALYAYDADLTINGGYFYGSLNALDARGLHSLNISNGYFKLYNQTEDGNLAAVYLGGDYSTNTIISGGRYYGNKGIEFSSKTDFSKIIPQGCYVTDNDTGLVIDHNITDYSLGGSIDIFAKRPRITTQPSGGHSLNMGDAIVLKIDADNANEYIWHIIDENGHELSWNYLSNNGYTTPNVYSGGKMLMLREVSDWMTGKRVYCEVKGYGGTVMSDIVTLSVDKVIKYCNDLYFEDLDQIWNHKTVGDFKNPINDADAPYTIGNVRWAMFRKILGDDYEFDSGDNVTVAIDVIPKEGYTFYSTVYGKLNGIDSTVTVKNQDGSRSIVFDMRITVPDEYKTQDIELSVTEPVAGKAPAETAICTSGYAIPGTPSWTPADTTFKSGTQYTVKISVKAEYEWGDTSTVTAKVNGKDAKFIAEYKGGKQYAYYVEYTFDATKDYLIGDVNNDGKVSVLDATEIQKYIAGLVTLSSAQMAAGDVNGDGNMTITDATQIQKHIAGLVTEF